jgi:hypothetical protein
MAMKVFGGVAIDLERVYAIEAVPYDDQREIPGGGPAFRELRFFMDHVDPAGRQPIAVSSGDAGVDTNKIWSELDGSGPLTFLRRFALRLDRVCKVEFGGLDDRVGIGTTRLTFLLPGWPAFELAIDGVSGEQLRQALEGTY